MVDGFLNNLVLFAIDQGFFLLPHLDPTREPPRVHEGCPKQLTRSVTGAMSRRTSPRLHEHGRAPVNERCLKTCTSNAHVQDASEIHLKGDERQLRPIELRTLNSDGRICLTQEPISSTSPVRDN